MPKPGRKGHLDPARRYRASLSTQPGEVSFQVVVEESDLMITARRDLSHEAADAARRLRGEIMAHAVLYPEFLTSLSPVAAPRGAPLIARRMCDAAARTGVGPMAAVAGAVAQGVAEALAEASPDVLVENGGDLYALSTRERTIGILADPSHGVALGVTIMPDEFPVSFCASSGRIGHSLSFGAGDLVAVRARDASLADAAATALCNRLRSSRDLAAVTDQAMAWEEIGIEGVFAQCDGRIALWGRMELTAIAGS
ncbi:ApbE family lipoprotein [Alkalidesulfovibrio alkalitolerans DSM 16529]|jgi:ApbE superfamily uncharacterized protein (UPF0280 family)|uniref:ApbE family lipoprotein n=1 Tax=Alkalidesulfovibrio alkalitolerans DSM 16529 TaxID=1121439 RepID=S7TDY8_9BACT|nr:UPF0280 family protein [Alkalidesulfovibrio alkalitolerans]EPR34765.1 ApbE family lipoprotein [Alkalidesulfovibrio alkalitolerans DSM 16529]